jgi:glycine/D-amino acid oxidase-like deaminating enzyme
VRNQVIVTEPLQTILPEGTFHVDEGYVYFRALEKRLLIGGFRNLDITGETTSQFGITEKIQNELEQFIRNYITEEELNIAYRWSGILGIGPTKLPILEKVSDRLYIGVRMGGMGVAIGNLIGKKLSELSV